MSSNVFYPRAPITEAVIAFNFTPLLSDDQVTKISKKNKSYAFTDKNQIPNYEINIQSHDVKINRLDDGVKLSSSDRTDICIYKKASFICSRLAPYSGWDGLAARARADWNVIQEQYKKTRVNRIGVRFINRIDVPCSPGTLVCVEDYLEIWPRLPPLGDDIRIDGYLMQLVRRAQDNCHVIINSAPVMPSPIPDAYSFILDIDLYREENLPDSEEGKWELIDKMRVVKNHFFENLITEKSRDLFR